MGLRALHCTEEHGKAEQGSHSNLAKFGMSWTPIQFRKFESSFMQSFLCKDFEFAELVWSFATAEVSPLGRSIGLRQAGGLPAGQGVGMIR